MTFLNMFLTQSHNSSAKTGLCVDELFQNFFEYQLRENFKWNQLEDLVLYTTYEAFFFWKGAYYLRMHNNVINSLIPTGIMSYLVEKHYTRKWKFEKIQKEPKVLSLDDLLFGFNIWIGCCLISCLALIAEKVRKSIKKPKVVKFLKTHPADDQSKYMSRLNPALISVFRNKKVSSETENFIQDFRDQC